MSGSEREDFLNRQIKGVAAMLVRIVGLRANGQTEDARAELEQLYGLLLGEQGELVRRVDASTAAMLLGFPEKILAFARLLDEEAAQETDGGRREQVGLRAVELAIEALRRDPGNEAARHFLEEALPRVDRRHLSSSYQTALEDIDGR
jgi:hypothetical protein